MTTDLAAMDDLVSLFGMIFDANRLHDAAAVRCPITWQIVEMHRVKTVRTMIATTALARGDLALAVGTDKGFISMCKLTQVTGFLSTSTVSSTNTE
jgi:hypothetical protein